MNIGILTFHFVPNHGAVLQCCATKTFLEKKGHDVRVVDYRPNYHTIRYSRYKNPVRYAMWFWKKHQEEGLLRRVKIFGQSFIRAIVLNSKKSEGKTLDAFDDFVSKNLLLTERYTSLNQLKLNPPRADAYVSGSDQLWNPQLLDQEFDKAYFLDFGNEQTARVAYAVSMGKIQDVRYLRELKECCKTLTAVSLREFDSDTVDATGRDVHICIDPTLLLDATDYEMMEGKSVEEEPYIFVYGFENTKEVHDAVEGAKHQYKCKIINGSPHRIFLEEAENLKDFGPDRFLTLIKNAKCVVTNSFHGTAFSIIYQKNFITVAHSTRGSRMIELLGKLGLQYRLWGMKEFSIEREINWDEATKKLSVLRQHSGDYLFAAIRGVLGENIPHWDEERF